MAKKPAAAEKKAAVQVVEKKKIKIKGGKPEEVKKSAPEKKESPKKKKEAPKKVAAKPATKKETPKKSQPEVKSDRLPGQKHDTPEEGDGSRIFYESLLRQNPDSKMAMKWCVENGVLDESTAKKFIAKLK